MAQLVIRDIPDEVIDALEQKASAAGKSREAWLRERLVDLSKGPLIKDRYALRIHGKTGRGSIRRIGDHPNGTSATFNNFSTEEADAVERAANFIRRNGPGDRETAIALLIEQFGTDNVFEVPV